MKSPSTPSFIFGYYITIRKADIPRAHKTLLFLLATYANPDGTNAFPSQAQLAEDGKYSDRQVRTLLKQLQDAGWVEVVSRGYGTRDGKSKASVYRLRVGRPFELAPEPAKQRAQAPAQAQPSRREVQPAAPPAKDRPVGRNCGWSVEDACNF